MTQTESLVNRLPNDIGGLPAELIRHVDHELEPWEKRCHADDVAQRIGVPIPAAQDGLPPPRAGVASRLGTHPTGLALLIAEQPFQEQTCIPRDTLLRE